jgi:hypothetical protein
MWTSPCEPYCCNILCIYQCHASESALPARTSSKQASCKGHSHGVHVDRRMRTAAGQCCFFALPDRDASGRSAHARVRTHESLCAGWLVLHKVPKSLQMTGSSSCCVTAHVPTAMGTDLVRVS